MIKVIALLMLALGIFASDVSAANTPPNTAPQTLFEFVSAPGDYIGGGQTVVLTPAQVTFNVQGTTGSNAISVSINNFSMPAGGGLIFWNIDFAAPNGAPLADGTYLNATRYPFQAPNVPGLALFGNGNGCNEDFGQFQVLEIAFDSASGAVSKFAANFVQSCESPSAPPLVGAIRYNSSIPPPELIAPIITVTSPKNTQGCFEASSSSGAIVTATASAVGGANLRFSWSTSTGLKQDGSTIYVPVALSQFVTLSLTATDSVTGKTATTSSQLCSSDTTPPTITIKSPVAGGTYRHLPLLHLEVTDAVDKNIKQVNVAVGENAAYALGRHEELFTFLTARRAVGDMIETQITVTATDASGNTGQASVSFLIEKTLH
jgi:Bacterial Ig-like domain (group 3)